MKLSLYTRRPNFIDLTLLGLAVILFSLPGEAKMLDRIVAVVNDDIITLSELEESGREVLDRVVENAPTNQRQEYLEEARQRLLTKLITERLINQQAAAANIRVSDEEFQLSYEKNLAQIGVSQQEFRRRLAENGLSEERYKMDLRNKLLRDKLIIYAVRSKVVVTDEMVKEYFEEKYREEVGDGGFYLLQMGFTWNNPEQGQRAEGDRYATREEAREHAERIRKMVIDGADFTALAREESDLPSAEDGGELGFFQEDELVPYMREAIVNLKVGEISPVIESRNSYQFFKLLSRQDEEESIQAHFEKVRGDIRAQLMENKFQEEYQKWVDQIKTGSYVKKML